VKTRVSVTIAEFAGIAGLSDGDKPLVTELEKNRFRSPTDLPGNMVASPAAQRGQKVSSRASQPATAAIRSANPTRLSTRADRFVLETRDRAIRPAVHRGRIEQSSHASLLT
jgi:hypothetical protein